MVEMNEQQLNNAIKNSMEQLMKEEGSANILVVGATGVGKSSLVNKVFNIDFVKTGVGKPVTQETTKYEVEGIPINLFDTKGYEIASEEHQRFISEMHSYMNDATKKPEDQIHMVWYVIAASGHRITDMDLQMLQEFKNTGKPVCVVFTKCDLASEETVQNLQQVLNDASVTNFYVSTNLPAMNYLQLNDLIEWTYNNMADSVKWAFLRSQKANLELTKQEVNKAIRNHALASFGIGFSPIPFTDGPILLANQGVMISRILNKYGLDGLFAHIETLIGALGIGQLVSQLGRYVVAQIVKFIPGIGTIAGGLINGTVATAITVSLGFTISEIGYQVAKAKLADEHLDVEAFIKKNFSPEMVQSLFEQFVKKEIDK